MKSCTILWYIADYFLEWEMFQTKFVEIIKIHILYSVTFCENRALYEIMWKKYGNARQAIDHNIIWCMRFGCWIIKSTDTNTQNMWYLLVFRCNNIYAKVPHCYYYNTLFVLINSPLNDVQISSNDIKYK